jgi:CRISPR/Cas system CSM-associated protein Csm3 (group 7 of RAMP superfamily)
MAFWLEKQRRSDKMINKSRQIIERIVVEGTLKLLTPTSLSNGDADGLTDISLIKDEFSGNALLTGTSICGALRNYLRECENGFNNADESPVAVKLFGSHEDDGSQSLLIIDDAVSSEKPKTELRDGVRIDRKTRTAVDKAKFDLELLESGTEFPLRFELLICEQRRNKEETAEEVKANTDNFKKELVSALATALQGFELGEINLGGRKRRGYGECNIEGWTAKHFDLKTKEGLLAYLGSTKHQPQINNGEKIIEVLKSVCSLDDEIEPKDIRNYFELNAWFAIDGSILIRSGSKFSDKYQPDSVHLRSKRNGTDEPIISGTSFGGVLRHRATKIVNTLKSNDDGSFVDSIFGVDMQKSKKETFASRLEVSETEIKTKENNVQITHDLVHTRVKIDRFTGGAFDSALFDAAPAFSDGEKDAVNLKLRLRDAKPCEIGLLLLLLKDLWTSDLAIGGESSIGRGRLKGKTASLNYKNGSGSWHSNMERIDDNKVKIDGIENNTEKIDLLNKFVNDFNHKLNPKEQNNVE